MAILKQLAVIKGSDVSVKFKFKMPRLAKGVYSIYVAVAEDLYNEVVMHHAWSDNCYVFKSNNTETFSGLFKSSNAKNYFKLKNA